MICFWKKNAAAPCACAFALRAPVVEVLNRLCELGPVTMVMRQRGLSMVKSTRFGLCVSDREGGWNVLRDRASGLEADASRPRSLYFFAEGAERRPVLAMGPPGRAVDLSIRLDEQEWDSRLIRGVLDQFEGAALDCLESRRLGAGNWLDDWDGDETPVKRAGFTREAAGCLRDCSELEVEVRTAGQRGTASFRPTFLDAEGAVLRIADRGGRHVVYADTASPDFRLIRLSSGRFRMFRMGHASEITSGTFPAVRRGTR